MMAQRATPKTVVSPAPKIRFGSLDGWRGIFALLVAIYHLRLQFWGYDFFLFRNAFLFVDFFFVLSGFVLAHSYANRLSNFVERRSFVIKRWGRLWPLHIVTLFALVILECIKYWLVSDTGASADTLPFSGDSAPWTLIPNILMVHGLGFAGETSWNFPSWSISCEFFAYLLFAIIISLWPTRKIIVFAMAALAGAAVLAWYPATIGVTTSFAFARAVFGFFTGAVAYLAWSKFADKRAPISGIRAHFLELAMVALVLWFIWAFPKGYISLLAPILFAATILMFAICRGALSAALETAPLQAIGRWSYSIYMVHVVILSWLYAILQFASNTLHLSWVDRGYFLQSQGVNDNLYKLFDSVFLTTIVGALYLMILLAISALTYRLIERPGQRLFSNWADGKKRTSPEANLSKMTQPHYHSDIPDDRGAG